MKIRKKILSFILAFLVAATTIYAPSIVSKAEEAAVSAPTNLRQTKTEKGKSITWKWNKAEGAVDYAVVISYYSSSSKKWVNAQTVYTGNKTTYTYKIKNLGSGCVIYVYSVDASGNFSGLPASKAGYTYPLDPRNVYIYIWAPGSGTVDLRFRGFKSTSVALPDGYQIQVSTLGGKKIATYKVKQNAKEENYYYDILSKTIPGIKNAGFKVKLRSYKKIDSGKVLYSKWTKQYAFIPQVQVTGFTSNSYSTKTVK